MDQESGIEKIRTATFTPARRGYEKREVEQFLNQIADWLETGGGDQARSDIVKRELERVGKRTASILASAEDSAEQTRADAEASAAETVDRAKSEAAAARKAADEYSAKTRAEADRYSAKTRDDADAYSAKTRDDADAYSVKTREGADAYAAQTRKASEQKGAELVAAAEAKAKRIVDEGTSRRRDVEAVISDLVARRDRVIADSRQLADELREVAGSHSADNGRDRFAEPAELDPAERVKT